MRHHIGRTAAISAAAILVPGAALAELSALDVWGSWKSYIENFGYEIMVESQTTGAGALTLKGMSIEMPVPDATVNLSLDLLEFQERGDGTVAVTMAPDMPFSISGDAGDGSSIDITMILRQTGLSLVASGDPGDVTYDYLAQNMSLDFDKFIVDGEELEPILTMAMNGVNGSFNMSEGELWTMVGRSSVQGLDMTMSFEDPEEGNHVDMTFSAEDMQTESEAAVPIGIDTTDPAWIFESGFSSRGTMASGPSRFTIELTGQDAFAFAGSAEKSELDFSLDQGAFDYSAAAFNEALTFSSPNLPFPPINVSLGEASFRMAAPMTNTDEPGDFHFVLRLLQLGVDEVLWQMFDAAGMLPHDPADIIIDFTGGIIMPDGMFDPDIAADPGAMAEPELHSLDVNQINLSVMGAEIDGKGAFTFDNTDLETFDGMPAPTGSVSFDIFGVNTLLDTLMAMGLLPQDQAMGARMTLGLFARPGGGGEDHLTSDIEVNPDGSVFANGQQLQ